MKKFFTTLFIILIVAFAIFSFFRYFYLLKINYSLEAKLRNISDRIVELENTKNNLEEILEKKKEEYLEISEEKQNLEDKLKDTESELSEKNADLEGVKEELQAAKEKTGNLNNEYIVLKQEIDRLRQTKDTIKLKFSSYAELKKAYADFKRKFHEARIELQSVKDKKEMKEGNRGYMLWEGQATSFKKVKIEVTPVEE